MWQTTSESIDQLSVALVKALGSMTDVKKGREAKVPTKAGSSYSYTYADLADTLQSVRPILAANDLAVLQNASTQHPDHVHISTTLLHSSGQWVTFAPLALPAGRTAQETGSAISYGRRYHLLACLGLAAEDDDGASAGPRGGRASQSRAKQETPRAASNEPRTEEERKIRDLLQTLDAETQASIRRGFVTSFGTLSALAPERHADALQWVELTLRDLKESN
jgi:hypothetical protein